MKRLHSILATFDVKIQMLNQELLEDIIREKDSKDPSFPDNRIVEL